MMDKPIFAQKNEGPKLSRILVAVGVVVAAAYGGLYAWNEFRGADVGRVEASAPALLEEATAMMAEGRLDEARQQLEGLLDSAPKASTAPRTLLLLGRVAEKQGDSGSARRYLEGAVNDFPSHPDRPRAVLALARVLEQDGRTDEARSYYEDVRERAAAPFRAAALTGIGRLEEHAGALETARGLYREAVETAEWGSEAWEEAVDYLGRANVALVFSQTPTSDSDWYEVKPGDNLIGIGVKLNTTQGLLTRANGISEDSTLRVGQRLKYTHKDFRIVIERETNRLFLFDGSGIFKVYSVGLGRPGHETTPGRYRIGDKQKNPDWFKPGEGRIPFGDPRNELGTRWMPMVPEVENLPRDLGIHGTFEPESVGGFTSSGCARLVNEEVEELYDLVVRATPVEVVDRIAPDTSN